MRLLNFFSILLVLLAPFCFAQSAALTAAISQLPACALPCLLTAIGDSPCALNNQTCICTNAQLQSNVEACVLQSCTIKEGLTSKNVTMTACNAPVRNKQNDIRSISITLGVISAVVVVLRIVYKLVLSIGELGWDDYAVLATLLSGIPSTIIDSRGLVPNGLGTDVWTVPFYQVTNFVRWFYVVEVLYFFQLAALKLTLLFFFLRIFPARNFQRIVWVTITFNILFGTAFVFAGIFQCQPIRHYWESWDGEHSGTCIDINALGWANAAISIALDSWMLLLPLWQVFQLKLAWKKKISVAMMFAVGTFVTVVSILRLQSLVHFANSLNPTWDQVDVQNWSNIEINVGIICACMPALRVLLVRLFPKVLGSTNRDTDQHYAKYGSHNPSLGRSGNMSNAMGSRLGRQHGGPPNQDGITYTKTFKVQHGDEEQLVHMDDLDSKGAKTRYSNSSEVSVRGAISPMQERHAPSRI